jgi:hypothetical protein
MGRQAGRSRICHWRNAGCDLFGVLTTCRFSPGAAIGSGRRSQGVRATMHRVALRFLPRQPPYSRSHPPGPATTKGHWGVAANPTMIATGNRAVK